MKLLVAIFAHNEEQTVSSVVRSIPQSLPGVDTIEIIVIDDGSDDATGENARSAGASVVRHDRKRGLAAAFMTAIKEALYRDADILAHTDGDNQYNQERLKELVAPLVEKKADVTVGNRNVKNLSFMPRGNKWGNLFGNVVLNWLLDLDGIDMSSGFRAYNRDCFSKLWIFSRHTYTHESLIQISALRYTVLSTPVEFVSRSNGPSRLISNVFNHLTRSSLAILRSILYYKPLKTFSLLGLICILLGTAIGIRFMWFFFQGDSSGHIQSLILMSIFVILGFMVLTFGLLADIINRNTYLHIEMLAQQRLDAVRAKAHPERSPRA